MLSRSGDEDLDASEDHAHAVHGRRDLLKIAHVRSHTQRRATGMFDLELCGIQLCLRAGHQSNTGARLGQSQGQTFAYAASRTGNQNALIFECSQKSILRAYRRCQFPLFPLV